MDNNLHAWEEKLDKYIESYRQERLKPSQDEINKLILEALAELCNGGHFILSQKIADMRRRLI